MTPDELNYCLGALRHGRTGLKMQFNFLFAAVSEAAPADRPHYSSLHFGKYQSQRAHATPFYKPYSKLFDLNLINENEPADL